MCNVTTFGEAGVALPSPGWNWDDFEKTCAALDAAIRAGRVKSAVSVLPPLVGDDMWPVGHSGVSVWDGGPFDSTVWGGFVVGFGGWIVNADGAFDLTNSGAVRGMEQLVALTRAYAGPRPATQAAGMTVFNCAAMRFLAQGVDTATTRRVPFPALPVREVVPATLSGGAPRAAGALLGRLGAAADRPRCWLSRGACRSGSRTWCRR